MKKPIGWIIMNGRRPYRKMFTTRCNWCGKACDGPGAIGLHSKTDCIKPDDYLSIPS